MLGWAPTASALLPTPFASSDGGYGGGGGGYGGGYGGGGYGGPPGGGYGKRDLDTVSLKIPNFDNLPHLEKNFYLEHPAVSAMSDTEVKEYRQRRDITVEGENVPKPVRTFEEASFPGADSATRVLGRRASSCCVISPVRQQAA